MATADQRTPARGYTTRPVYLQYTVIRRLATHARSPAALTVAGRSIQYATQLAMVILVPKALAPDVYVQLNLLLPLALMGVTLLFGWFATSIYRHVYDLLDPDNPVVRQTAFFYYGCLILALLAVYLAASVVTESIYRLVPLLLLAAGLKNGILHILNASGKYRVFFFANIGFAVPLATFIALCFLNTEDDLERYLTVYAGLDLVLAAGLWSFIGVFRLQPPPRFDTSLARGYLRYGLPMVVNNLAVWVISLSDRYLLAIWEQTDAVASYILGYQLGASAITIPLSFMATVMYPRILKLDKEEGERTALAWTYRLLGGYLRLMPLIFVAAGAIVLPFMYYVYPAYIFNPEILLIIILAHVVSGLSHFYNKEFELNGNTLMITRAVGAGALSNIGLNLVLIPLVGVMGAAVATLAAYSLTVFLVYRARQYAPA